MTQTSNQPALFLNTLSFDYPKEPVTIYFSTTNDVEHRSDLFRSLSSLPKEVKAIEKYNSVYHGSNATNRVFVSYCVPMDGFEPIQIDFRAPENYDFVKRYYTYRLEKYLYRFDGLIVGKSGITNDIQVCISNPQTNQTKEVGGISYSWNQIERWTLKVRYDTIHNHPYILVSSDHPTYLLNQNLCDLFNGKEHDPFGEKSGISLDMLHKVLIVKNVVNSKSEPYQVRKIESFQKLHESGKSYDPMYTYPLLSRGLKLYFGIDCISDTDKFESKYIKYYNSIDCFRYKYLSAPSLKDIFLNLSDTFSVADSRLIRQIESTKRDLRFGRNSVSPRPQMGVNYGPAKSCPDSLVQLIAIYPASIKSEASVLLRDFKNGTYMNKNGNVDKCLAHYIGVPSVGYCSNEMHIAYQDESNPLPEVKQALMRPSYRNKSKNYKYVAIYISKIHKYGSDSQSKECYYKIKELLLKRDIVSQCVDYDKMKRSQDNDKRLGKSNFSYSLQNMFVAICAKLGGTPWVLNGNPHRELIIGIGAFKSDNQQYIGAAFSFDNTGIFNDYCYFQKSELNELIGAIRIAIINYSSSNTRPSRLIIHYYKQISQSREFQKIETMLHRLGLSIPVFVVTINKTESEDIVLFDSNSRYDGNKTGYMPYSGTWLDLGRTRTGGYRFLLCNNTRYENTNFNKMDGFPFPVKLTITSNASETAMDSDTIQQLIEQVYQFSRIYWKSVKQQPLPVTIKYPEMIAEIMPHFDDPTVHLNSQNLWFL